MYFWRLQNRMSPNYWTLVGSGLYPNQISYKVGIGVVNPWAKLQVETSRQTGQECMLAQEALRVTTLV